MARSIVLQSVHSLAISRRFDMHQSFSAAFLRFMNIQCSAPVKQKIVAIFWAHLLAGRTRCVSVGCSAERRTWSELSARQTKLCVFQPHNKPLRNARRSISPSAETVRMLVGARGFPAGDSVFYRNKKTEAVASLCLLKFVSLLARLCVASG